MGARVISAVLVANPNLEQVYLRKNSLGNQGATLLLESVKTAKALQYLSLDQVNVDNGVVSTLSATLQERASSSSVLLRGQQGTPLTISLHGNNISTVALEHLASQLPRSSTDRIICGMRVVQKGEIRMRSLSQHFANYAHRGGLGDLMMNNIGIDQRGVAQITAHIEHDRSAVEVLRLGFNSVQDEGAALLAKALSNNSTLRGLTLSGNKIGCRGFAALTDVLVQSNTSLQWLELGKNPIFDGSQSRSVTETQDQLGKLLTSSVGLKYLGLYATGLGDDECGVVAAALAENTGSISFLSLDGNRISDKGSTVLAGGLEQNTTVRYLDLSYNHIGQVGAAAISRCAQVREQNGYRLLRVWMAGNKMDASQLTGCMVDTTCMYENCCAAMSTYL